MRIFSSIILQRIQSSSLEADRKKKVIGNLGHPNDDEIAILFGVMNIRAIWILHGRHDPIAEILKGGHVRIFDFGHLYDQWKSLPSAATVRLSKMADVMATKAMKLQTNNKKRIS
jgi:hypothetical protein